MSSWRFIYIINNRFVFISQKSFRIKLCLLFENELLSYIKYIFQIEFIYCNRVEDYVLCILLRNSRVSLWNILVSWWYSNINLILVWKDPEATVDVYFYMPSWRCIYVITERFVFISQKSFRIRLRLLFGQ